MITSKTSPYPATQFARWSHFMRKAAVGLLFIAAGCSRQEPAAHAQTTRQVPVRKAEAQQPASITAQTTRTDEAVRCASRPQPAYVAAYEQTDLYAKVAGYLEIFGQVQRPDGKTGPVDIGDPVVKGQVLAVIAVPEMEQERVQKEALVAQAQAEVGQATAAVRGAEAMIEAKQAEVEEARSQVARYDADLAFRKAEHERIARLVRERAVQQGLEDEKLNQFRAAEAAKRASEASLMTADAEVRVEKAALVKAQADLVSAEARLIVARANLQHTVILLEYANIKAPYDGIVVRRTCERGTFVQSAASGKPEPLFTIARVDRLRIVSDVPESEAGLVTVGQPALFHTDGSRVQPLSGKVARLAGGLDSATRTMRVEVELDGPGPGLRPGMFGSLSILEPDSSAPR
jgi:multidrug resistance efflux pump